VDWRPQARADWGAGVAAGCALALPLLVGTATGRPEAGAALVLPVVLVVIPLPLGAGMCERARRLAARTAAITLAGICAYLLQGHVWALVPAVALAAAAGALLPRVGVTAALAVLLVGLTGPVDAFDIPGLPQLTGCLWGAVLALPRWARPSPGPAAPASAPEAVTAGRAALGHAARLGLLSGAATAAMAALPHLAGEGHWLVTGALLALTPTREATALKARQRGIGNSLGGIAAALALAVHPGAWAISVLVAVTGTLAYALRPANYLYWCLAFPPLLLLLTDFDNPLPWYVAGVRATLVLAGGGLAVLASRWPRL
jgi:hypothetical protein